MNIDFTNKVALVTGAGRGIGKVLVKKLVEIGAKVIAVSKTKANLEALKAELPSIVTVCVDLSNWDETIAALSGVGPVDFLVNNAAYAELTPVGEATSDVFDKHFNLNVKALINVTQIISTGMKSRGVGGAIVNLSSQAGMVALKDHLCYCASKGAVDQVTRVCALELGPYGIRVNSVNPTVTMTEMAKVGWSEPVKAAAMKALIPLGKFAEPEDVVNSIVFLLSDKAAMINGVLLPIDGGFTAC